MPSERKVSVVAACHTLDDDSAIVVREQQHICFRYGATRFVSHIAANFFDSQVRLHLLLGVTQPTIRPPKIEIESVLPRCRAKFNRDQAPRSGRAIYREGPEG